MGEEVEGYIMKEISSTVGPYCGLLESKMKMNNSERMKTISEEMWNLSL